MRTACIARKFFSVLLAFGLLANPVMSRSATAATLRKSSLGAVFESQGLAALAALSQRKPGDTLSAGLMRRLGLSREPPFPPYQTLHDPQSESYRDWLGLCRSLKTSTSIPDISKLADYMRDGILYPADSYVTDLTSDELAAFEGFKRLLPTDAFNGEHYWCGPKAPKVSWFVLLDYAFFLTNLIAGHYRTGVDPYQKGVSERIQQGVRYLNEIARDPNRNPAAIADHVQAVRQMLQNILYANKYEGTAEFKSDFYIFWDDSRELALYLVKRMGNEGIVDIFVDNLGPELSAHLVLANYLVDHRLAKTVRLHIKAEPFSVSDVWGQKEAPLRAHILPTLEAFSKSNLQTIRELGLGVGNKILDGTIQFQADEFLSRVSDFRQEEALLRFVTPNASLICMVGDNLYRKVFGNRDWHGRWHTRDPKRIQAVLPRLEAPLALIRGVKSDIKLGVPEDTPVDKTRGVIQFFSASGASVDWIRHISWMRCIQILAALIGGVTGVIPVVLGVHSSDDGKELTAGQWLSKYIGQTFVPLRKKMDQGIPEGPRLILREVIGGKVPWKVWPPRKTFRVDEPPYFEDTWGSNIVLTPQGTLYLMAGNVLAKRQTNPLSDWEVLQSPYRWPMGSTAIDSLGKFLLEEKRIHPKTGKKSDWMTYEGKEIFDAAGNLFFLPETPGALTIVPSDREKTYTYMLYPEGMTEKPFSDLAFGPDQRLYVNDEDCQRILVFEIQGLSQRPVTIAPGVRRREEVAADFILQEAMRTRDLNVYPDGEIWGVTYHNTYISVDCRITWVSPEDTRVSGNLYRLDYHHRKQMSDRHWDWRAAYFDLVISENIPHPELLNLLMRDPLVISRPALLDNLRLLSAHPYFQGDKAMEELALPAASENRRPSTPLLLESRSPLLLEARSQESITTEFVIDSGSGDGPNLMVPLKQLHEAQRSGMDRLFHIPPSWTTVQPQWMLVGTKRRGPLLIIRSSDDNVFFTTMGEDSEETALERRKLIQWVTDRFNKSMTWTSLPAYGPLVETKCLDKKALRFQLTITEPLPTFPMLGSTANGRVPLLPGIEIQNAWKRLGPYLIVNDALPEKVDTALMFGGDLTAVAEGAARLATEYCISTIAVAGGRGRLTPQDWWSEAAVLAEIIQKLLPDAHVFVEHASANTRQNAAFGFHIIRHNVGTPPALLGIQIPLQSLRAKKTLEHVVLTSDLHVSEWPEIYFRAPFDLTLTNPLLGWALEFWMQRWLYEAVGEISGLIEQQTPGKVSIAQTKIPRNFLLDAKLIADYLSGDESIPPENQKTLERWLGMIRRHLESPPEWSPVVASAA